MAYVIDEAVALVPGDMDNEFPDELVDGELRRRSLTTSSPP